jgi:hypothetical protein
MRLSTVNRCCQQAHNIGMFISHALFVSQIIGLYMAITDTMEF